MKYNVAVVGHNNAKCTDKEIFREEETREINFLECNSNTNVCPPVFLAQKSYFTNSNFRVNVWADNSEKVNDKVFSKIELITTTRAYSYVMTLTFLKAIFSICSISCLVYFILRIKQYNFFDIGIIQKKLLLLVIFLILFNEPLYFFNALVPHKMLGIINTVIQATFIAMLLHFWAYLIDTISEEDVIRENPIKFYGPKLCLVVLIWIFLLAALTLVRVQEAVDPTFYWNVETKDFKILILSWLLFLLLALYSLYLGSITYKACSHIRRLKETYKYVIAMTLGVIIGCIFFLGFLGLQKYVSMASSAFKVLSIEALLNFYIYMVVYLYSPCKMSTTSGGRNQKDREHRQIINQLYEQELPEMPTMREDHESYADKEIGDYKEAEQDAENNTNKSKIWEQIEKQIEEEDEGEEDEGDDDDIPAGYSDDESPNSSSDEEKPKGNDTQESN